MKLCFVFGTRPEILKLNSVVKEAISRKHEVILVHTGQHYDYEMSEVFFKELALPSPDIYLDIGSGTNNYQVGNSMAELDKSLRTIQPDAVVVVGDTNAGVAGAIAAVLATIPVIHVESGARSFDMTMPEEVNRKLIDSISKLCFCPTEESFANLKQEKREHDDIYLSGDTLVETSMNVDIPDSDDFNEDEYILVTLHRADNTNDVKRLKKILIGLSESSLKIVFPMHPRTKKMVADEGLDGLLSNMVLLKPQPYTKFLSLIKNAALIITDSGGVQQEAGIFKKYCLTLRQNTEWVNTIKSGGNRLVDIDKEDIATLIANSLNKRQVKLPTVFELGASIKILDTIERYHCDGNLIYKKSYQVV